MSSNPPFLDIHQYHKSLILTFACFLYGNRSFTTIMKNTLLLIKTTTLLFAANISKNKMHLHQFWGKYLDEKSQCPTQIQWTCEHVIPQSFIKNKHIANDLPNLILLPAFINNARSNFKYGQQLQNVTKKIACQNCTKQCANISYISKDKNQTHFTPPAMYKGIIARAVLQMIFKYPHTVSLVNCSVLDIHTAYNWHIQHPPHKLEQKWIEHMLR